ncbi:MAG: hypothetical protein ACPG9S_06575, partial [Flavobacteriales bacterium]
MWRAESKQRQGVGVFLRDKQDVFFGLVNAAVEGASRACEMRRLKALDWILWQKEKKSFKS